MSIFTKLSLFFFFAFVVAASLPFLTDQMIPEKSAYLAQLFASLCMMFYILDMVVQARNKRLKQSEAEHGKDPVGNLVNVARESELAAAQRDLKNSEDRLRSSQDRIASLESKLKNVEGDDLKADQAVVQFLRSLQSKGRLIDFVMTDIHRIPDPQVGAVARIVHQGVRDLLQDYFQIAPVAAENEGSMVPVKKDDLAHAYRVLQDGSTDTPAQGRLVHRGWQALSRKLPRSVQKENEENLRVLAPAEIDARTNQI